MSKLTILGSGAWGTALATVLQKKFEQVILWCYLEEEKKKVFEGNKISMTTSLQKAVENADIIISAVPSFAIQSTWEQIVEYTPQKAVFINASKGIERDTHRLPYQVFDQLFHQKNRYLTLCGPSFAEET